MSSSAPVDIELGLKQPQGFEGKSKEDATPKVNANMTDLSFGEQAISFLWGLFCIICPVMWIWCIRMCKQYERLVHLRFGKLMHKKALGPGLFFFLPGIDVVRVVDMRITTIDVPPQNCMTKESVVCTVNAVAFSYVTNAMLATLNVEHYEHATALLAQTTLRSVVGDSYLDQLVTAREYNAAKLCTRLDEATDKWGIKVCAVEISDLNLPPDMQKAMAIQAESERERRAKIINADAELQSAKALAQAAQNLNKSPAALQLRFFQTLANIGTDQHTTIYFPLPVSFAAAGDGSAPGHVLPVD